MENVPQLEATEAKFLPQLEQFPMSPGECAFVANAPLEAPMSVKATRMPPWPSGKQGSYECCPFADVWTLPKSGNTVETVSHATTNALTNVFRI